jgi:acyl-coenzyme A thioesterase PaaI-like protein
MRFVSSFSSFPTPPLSRKPLERGLLHTAVSLSCVTLFLAGPACGEHGLHLRSFRDEEGLIAWAQIPDKYCCFPGVISGGAISTLLDCHGSWAASVMLMDEACLPRPPLAVTYSLSLTYQNETPPDTPLILRAKVCASDVRCKHA